VITSKNQTSASVERLDGLKSAFRNPVSNKLLTAARITGDSIVEFLEIALRDHGGACARRVAFLQELGTFETHLHPRSNSNGGVATIGAQLRGIKFKDALKIWHGYHTAEAGGGESVTAAGGTTICSFNVDGLKATLRSPRRLVFFLSVFSFYRIDICFLQELKISDSDVAGLTAALEAIVPEFRVHIEAGLRPGHAGVGAMVRRSVARTAYTVSFPVIDPPVATQPEVEETLLASAEGRIVELRFKKYLVCGIYAVNARADLGRLPIRLLWSRAVAENIRGYGIPAIVTGDFNAVLEDSPEFRTREARESANFPWGQSPSTTDDERASLQEFAASIGCTPLRGATYTMQGRFSTKEKLTLDYCLVPVGFADRAKIHTISNFRDHSPLVTCFDNKLVEIVKQK
jgi:exonuclease III